MATFGSDGLLSVELTYGDWFSIMRMIDRLADRMNNDGARGRADPGASGAGGYPGRHVCRWRQAKGALMAYASQAGRARTNSLISRRACNM